jgi:hypothetical protein
VFTLANAFQYNTSENKFYLIAFIVLVLLIYELQRCCSALKRGMARRNMQRSDSISRRARPRGSFISKAIDTSLCNIFMRCIGGTAFAAVQHSNTFVFLEMCVIALNELEMCVSSGVHDQRKCTRWVRTRRLVEIHKFLCV